MPAERAARPGAGVAQGNASPFPEAERWARVKAMFLAALDRPDRERAAFLAEACAGDEELRSAVEELLASDTAAGSFGETPAAVLLARDGPASDAAPVRLPAGTRLGAYEVIAFVAAGGMGEVYRARHVLLGREVAIKVVNGASADPEARRRLLREARHAAVLDHPNVCRVYDVGQTGGLPFIAMELAGGQPLSAVLQERPLSLVEVLSLGSGIADALEHAHQHGIVHRDLKSANVVVRADGSPLVLDFGLARRLPGAGAGIRDSTLTQPLALAGTLSHMAPEVLLGGRADARSDIWSLGVLLYELATGELPFPGRTPFETTAAILDDPPRTPARKLPLSLRLIIERCLTKDPARRYQHAREIRSALEALRRRRAWPVAGRLLFAAHARAVKVLGAGAVLVPLVLVAGVQAAQRMHAPALALSALAVLPLDNAGGDAGSAYYASGVTDALSSQLGAASVVRVVSVASVTRAVRIAGSAAEIGRQLGADALVDGSVRREAHRVVLELRLFAPADGRVLWSQRFERAPRDVLALEADAVRALTLALRRPLRPASDEQLSRVRAVSPEVYEEYLKGRYEWSYRTPGSLQRAAEHFAAAVRLDPSYAPAHAALADCYNQLATVMVGAGSPRRFRPLAAAEAIKALQIDPYSAEAHAALGYVRHYDWQWADAERELRRAIELNPSYALAHAWYANLLSSLGRDDEALRQALQARDLDPFSLVVVTNVGWTLQLAGRHSDAIVEFRRAMALDSTYIQAHWRLGQSLAALHRYPEALGEMRRAVELSHGSAPALSELAQIEVAAGQTGEARALAEDLLARSRREYVPPAAVASLLAKLGRQDEALEWMRQAVDERSNALAYVRPGAKGPLLSDPRFQLMFARAQGR